jgi:pyruvate dehydrogenase E1 component
MFEANGWNVVEAKYGSLLESAFAMDKGELLRESIDNMPNQMYQRLLRSDGLVIRDWLPKFTKHESDLREFINQWDNAGLLELISNLGGHDFNTLRERFETLDVESGPNVVFAYTLKGWKLPTVGDPQNHSVLLNSSQMEEFRNSLNIKNGEEFEGFDLESKVGLYCSEVSTKLNSDIYSSKKDVSYIVPKSFSKGYSGNMSTQQIFGLILTELTRSAKEISDRIVTVSPDVASSTNLGGWINKVGVWSKHPSEELPVEQQIRALTWEESDKGQHLELGISENNLFICLGQLGLTNERDGELVLPIGTLYDPFIRRGLDALVYSLQSGGKFIFVGTPSGLTLSPEGGSHQSIVTPSIGYELPELNYYEPCYGKELEWILLDSLNNIKDRKASTYLRLTSKRIDQSYGDFQGTDESIEIRRQQVIKGAYRIIDRSNQSGYSLGNNVVNILACGAILPEAIKASEDLVEEGIYANVINITGPGPLYQDFQYSVSSKLAGKLSESYLKKLMPESSLRVPVVTVVAAPTHDKE